MAKYNGIYSIPTGKYNFLFHFHSHNIYSRMVHCNLLTKKCDCGVFNIKKFPCVHALALLHRLGEKSGKKVEDLCDPYYRAETGNSFVLLFLICNYFT